jgi:hypothetical protein
LTGVTSLPADLRMLSKGSTNVDCFSRLEDQTRTSNYVQYSKDARDGGITTSSNLHIIPN